MPTKTLNFDDVARMFERCQKCEADLWSTWTPAQQAEAYQAVTDSEFAAKGWKGMQMAKGVCEECSRSEIAAGAKQKRIERYRSMVSDGLVKPGISRYETPPAAIEALNPAAWRFAREGFLISGGHVLAHGPEGVGKSSLARYLLCRTIDKGHSAMELAASDCEYTLWSSWRPECEKTVQMAENVRVLLIDDLGAVPWTSRGLGVLRRIVDYRHETRKAMLITSNLSPGELLNKVVAATGDRTFAESLLRRFAPLKELKMSGESFRRSMVYGQTEKDQ